MYALVQQLQASKDITLWEYHTAGQHADKLEELRKIAIEATAKNLGSCHMDMRQAEKRINKLRKA